jgi:protein-S-isoprenylcysteine O-methyltransferase Ste14
VFEVKSGEQPPVILNAAKNLFSSLLLRGPPPFPALSPNVGIFPRCASLPSRGSATYWRPSRERYHGEARMIYLRIVTILWLALILYWLVSAGRTKKTAHRPGRWPAWAGSRILIVALVIFALEFRWKPGPISAAPALRVFGVLLCAAGIAFAIWARATLGANWSPVPSIKHEHELVTTGPYRFVRHPIYSGMWFALLGSAFAVSLAWFAGLAVASLIFAYRIRVEERLMLRQFPADYPAYRRRTKALIPLLL